LQSRGIVQVSMNLTNYEQTSIARAFDAVRAEAARLNIKVQGAEIVGLVPAAAFDPDATYYPFLENFHEGIILENLLK
jgi:glutamate formiminotransferase